jgi:hypothetical protein
VTPRTRPRSGTPAVQVREQGPVQAEGPVLGSVGARSAERMTCRSARSGRCRRRRRRGSLPRRERRGPVGKTGRVVSCTTPCAAGGAVQARRESNPPSGHLVRRPAEGCRARPAEGRSRGRPWVPILFWNTGTDDPRGQGTTRRSRPHAKTPTLSSAPGGPTVLTVDVVTRSWISSPVVGCRSTSSARHRAGIPGTRSTSRRRSNRNAGGRRRHDRADSSAGRTSVGGLRIRQGSIEMTARTAARFRLTCEAVTLAGSSTTNAVAPGTVCA